jgi:hypothetical protein
MRGQRDQVRRTTRGAVCLDAGNAVRVTGSVPSTAGFDRALLPATANWRCPNRSKARSSGAVLSNPEQFIVHTVVSLAVGWQTIEIYPRFDESCWKPEYGAVWAKLDLLSAIAQRNAIETALHQLDGRGAARERYAKLLEELEALLSGPEEPCHQFLKSHPELICPTYDAYWSKKTFGGHISDFVFREPPNDYLLVEIEAPHRLLFRKDGHPRQTLTHA